jgi:hypothetical protein
MIDYNAEDRTFDCPPSLNDEQVVDFCRDGYLLLRGVVPDETNRRTLDWLNGERPAEPVAIPPGMTADDLQRIRDSHEPSSIFLEEWFLRDVLLNEQLVGVMRSLLGCSVQLPVLASHHGTQCPQPAQGWHHDADRVFGPELNYVEVFYFPQDTPIELGPTELVPGTHMRHTSRRAQEGGLFSDGPAGTLGIHHQSILHRRGASTGALGLLSGTGSISANLTSARRILAATNRHALQRICTTGCADAAMRFARTAVRHGPGARPTRLVLRRDLRPLRAIGRIGRDLVPTATLPN